MQTESFVITLQNQQIMSTKPVKKAPQGQAQAKSMPITVKEELVRLETTLREFFITGADPIIDHVEYSIGKLREKVKQVLYRLPSKKEDLGLFYYHLVVLLHSFVLQYTPYFLSFKQGTMSDNQRHGVMEFVSIVVHIIERVSAAQNQKLEDPEVADPLKGFYSMVISYVLHCFCNGNDYDLCALY